MQRSVSSHHSGNRQLSDESSDGFTLIELIVVIVVIAMLAGIVVFSPKTFLVTSRDQERADDAASIARRLEEAYSAQDLGSPVYPSTADLTTDITNKTRTMSRMSPEAFLAPKTTTNSVVMATTNSSTTPTGVAGQPTISQYVYQPLDSTGAICQTAGASCVRFNIYYRLESNNSLQTIKSIHQQ